MRNRMTIALAAFLAAACNDPAPRAGGNTTNIKVRSPEQAQLHQLDALNLAIALKRAIRDAQLPCDRVTDAGFVGTYENLEMWAAKCETTQWAVFAGPDGSAQVRDCKDVAATGLPPCTITRRPEGSFSVG